MRAPTSQHTDGDTASPNGNPERLGRAIAVSHLSHTDCTRGRPPNRTRADRQSVSRPFGATEAATGAWPPPLELTRIRARICGRLTRVFASARAGEDALRAPRGAGPRSSTCVCASLTSTSAAAQLKRQSDREEKARGALTALGRTGAVCAAAAPSVLNGGWAERVRAHAPVRAPALAPQEFAADEGSAAASAEGGFGDSPPYTPYDGLASPRDDHEHEHSPDGDDPAASPAAGAAAALRAALAAAGARGSIREQAKAVRRRGGGGADRHVLSKQVSGAHRGRPPPQRPSRGRPHRAHAPPAPRAPCFRVSPLRCARPPRRARAPPPLRARPPRGRGGLGGAPPRQQQRLAAPQRQQPLAALRASRSPRAAAAPHLLYLHARRGVAHRGGGGDDGQRSAPPPPRRTAPPGAQLERQSAPLVVTLQHGCAAGTRRRTVTLARTTCVPIRPPAHRLVLESALRLRVDSASATAQAAAGAWSG